MNEIINEGIIIDRKIDIELSGPIGILIIP